MSIQSQIQDISHAFRTDAGHQLIKAKSAFEHGSVKMRTGYQAKIVVDLFMSAECALKSLVCSRGSHASAESVLREILKIGHDLKKLMKVALPSSLAEDEKQILLKLNKKGVSLRYDLDLTILVTSELLQSDSVDFKIDADYVNSLIGIVEKLSTEAQESHKRRFTTEPKVMKRSEADQEIIELRKLLKDVRKKRPKKA